MFQCFGLRSSNFLNFDKLITKTDAAACIKEVSCKVVTNESDQLDFIKEQIYNSVADRPIVCFVDKKLKQ